MSDFRIAFEAWSNRPPELGDDLVDEEIARLQDLRDACEAVETLEWWNDYKRVGKNERGPHYGVCFGYERREDDQAAFTAKIKQIVLARGFNFVKGPLTYWQNGLS